jgi:hypothetical protein
MTEGELIISKFRKWTGRASATVGLVAAGALALSGVSVADQIVNSLDMTIDATAEIMPLNVGGPAGTTTLYVHPTGFADVPFDAKDGCNITGTRSVTIGVASNFPTRASVSPSSLTFTSCDDVKTITVTPRAEGSANISTRVEANNTGGTFTMNTALFTAVVGPPAPANTPPKISVAGVTGGASYAKGSVPSAVCQVTDSEDGPSSFPATLSAVAGAYAADRIGTQGATCSYTDKGGLTAAASSTYSVVDPSAPVIGYTLDPSAPDNDNGWYKSSVSLAWTVGEPQSPTSLVTNGCVDATVSADQDAVTYTCSASSAGGTAERSVTIKRDATAPTVAFDSASGTAGQDGWYTSPVDVTFRGTDSTSGVTAATKTARSSTEGGAVVVESPAFTDAAGNTTPAGAATRTYKIDTTAPSAPVFVGGAASYYFGDEQTRPTCTSTDAVSGLASCTVTGGSTAVGTHTYTATAVDNAGNSTTSTTTYLVKAWTLKGFTSPVDMNGVWNTVKGGSTVPLKFDVLAGSTKLKDLAAVDSLTVKSTTCPGATAPTDDIELVTTGGTSLRYDLTAGQFIQNWQTPKKPGTCHTVTMRTDDGSAISANFQLR